MLMDYMATYPNTKIRYLAGTMQLRVDSDAAYLVMPEAKSRITVHYMLEANHNKHSEHPPSLNVSILIECQALKHVACSTAEAE